MPRIELYVTTYCPYCIAAKQLFDRKGVEYEVINVTGDHAKRSWLREATGQRTVPQIFIDGVSYGGYTDVAALDRRGELDSLIHPQARVG